MDNYQLSNLLHIQHASQQGQLVVFVGAGVSANSGVPTWSQLIKEMKKECNLEFETDDLKIAQLYKDSKGHKEYMDKVKDVLKCNKVIPNQIHKEILSLKPSHIITTNYDNLIEQEIQNQFKQYALVREDKDMPNMTYPNSLIKMHGDYETDNIVLAEKDYYDYPKNFPLIRSFVLSLFASKMVVFVGFSFADLNLKMIINELQSILSDNMQRVYMIVDSEPDMLTYRYYEKKGVNLVYLSNSDLDEIINSSSKNVIPHFSSNKGEHLYKMLIAINLCEKEKNTDLISYVYKQIKGYDNEIKSFGDALKYFFPEEEREIWHLHSGGLQIESPYFKQLSKQLSSYCGKRKFITDHSHIDFTELKRIAHQNYLYSINEIRIIDSSFFKRIMKYYNGYSAPVYIDNFDFESLNKRLKLLSSRDLTGDADDLEYPFTLYLLGDYYEAYKMYNQILPLAWKNQKYILYFICLYNICSIKKGIFNQLILNEQIDYELIINKIDNIDLEEVLSRLPIDSIIRNLFQNLLSFNSIGSSSVETEELKEQLHQQRINGEKGGWSVNSNISSIMSKYEREFHFCRNNFIICDNNKYYDSVCKNTISGILNSFATPDPKNSIFGGCSKLDLLNPLSVHIMVFCIVSKDLECIFKQYDIEVLKLDDKAIDLTNTLFKNLHEAKEIPFCKHSLFQNYFENLIYVISKVQGEQNNIDPDLIYSTIIKYWDQILHFRINGNLLLSVLENHAPNVENINQLIDRVIKEERLDYCLRYLVYLLDKQNCKYENIKLHDFDKESIQSLFVLYPILQDNIQDVIRPLIESDIKKFSSYLEFIVGNDIEVKSIEKFKELIYNYKSRNEYDNAYCSLMLAHMYNKKIYRELRPIIKRYARKNECLSFFLNPVEYPNYKNVKIEWILQSDKEDIIKLMSNPVYKDLVKNELKDQYYNKARRAKLLSYL